MGLKKVGRYPMPGLGVCVCSCALDGERERACVETSSCVAPTIHPKPVCRYMCLYHTSCDPIVH